MIGTINQDNYASLPPFVVCEKWYCVLMSEHVESFGWTKPWKRTGWTPHKHQCTESWKLFLHGNRCKNIGQADVQTIDCTWSRRVSDWQPFFGFDCSSKFVVVVDEVGSWKSALLNKFIRYDCNVFDWTKLQGGMNCLIFQITSNRIKFCVVFLFPYIPKLSRLQKTPQLSQVKLTFFAPCKASLGRLQMMPWHMG